MHKILQTKVLFLISFLLSVQWEYKKNLTDVLFRMFFHFFQPFNVETAIHIYCKINSPNNCIWDAYKPNEFRECGSLPKVKF